MELNDALSHCALHRDLIYSPRSKSTGESHDESKDPEEAFTRPARLYLP